MANLAEKPWTVETFFAWHARQSERYELVAGFPLRLMAVASNRHDDISVNLIIALGTRLRGGPCRPFRSDGAVETFPGQIRRPDAGVDCGKRDPNAFQAADPKLVAEVMSPSTRDFDTLEKLAEYKAMAGLDVILFVESNAAQVVAWCRTEDRSWDKAIIEGLEAHVTLASLGIELPLREIYDGVEFPVGQRLALV